jgi:hypothetical protein
VELKDPSIQPYNLPSKTQPFYQQKLLIAERAPYQLELWKEPLRLALKLLTPVRIEKILPFQILG